MVQRRRTFYAFCSNKDCSYVDAYLERTAPQANCPLCGKPIIQDCVRCSNTFAIKSTVCTECIEKRNDN